MSQKIDKDVNHPLTLLFLGDSLIDYADWPHRLPHYNVISSGMPGERTEELLWRLPRTIPEPLPDMIIVMTGTNNILFGDTSFIESLRQIVELLSHSAPNAQRIITSLLPYEIPGFQESICQVNDSLREIADQSGSYYFDLYEKFKQTAETMFEYDGVHLSEAAYRLWSSHLETYLFSRLAK